MFNLGIGLDFSFDGALLKEIEMEMLMLEGGDTRK